MKMRIAAFGAACLVAGSTAFAQTADPAGAAGAMQNQPAPASAAAPATPAESAPVAAPATPAQTQAPAADAPIVGYTADQKPASFIMMTAGHAMFAAVGAVAAIAQGHGTAVKYELKDSANLVTPELAKAWADAKGYRLAAGPIAVDDAHKNIIKTATKDVADLQGARYVVDGAASVNAIYFPFDWTHYGLIYTLVTRVVDANDGKVVAKAHCVLKPKKTPESPTGDQMFADNAAVLKKMMADDAQECLPKLKEDLLKP